MAKLRKKFFVDSPVQGALVRRIILHWGIFFVLVSMTIFAAEWFLGGVQLGFVQQLGEVWSKYAFFFLLMLFILPTFVYDTVKVSHRFAGPITRLKGALKSLADGEPVPTLKFREDDYWSELAADFNRIAARVHSIERPSSCESAEADEACSTLV
jgi:hypothetical protein